MKINDTKLYLYFSIITLIIGLALAGVSYYSILVVEPEIKHLLSQDQNVSENYRRAYLMLRDPQIFARYENFDRDSYQIKSNIIPYLDNEIYNSRSLSQADSVYLNVLLERRKQGSILGRNTMVFFFMLSLMGWIFFIYECIKVKQD